LLDHELLLGVAELRIVLATIAPHQRVGRLVDQDRDLGVGGELGADL
jgi:hypothetical protein